MLRIPLSIMVKPASGSCNMNCSYCFYKESFKKRKNNNSSMMELSLMKEIIDKIKLYGGNNHSIVFQGGEPLLRGYDFFKEIFEYSKDLDINFSLQTNGLLLDEKFIKLFKKYNVLLGLSLDGFEEINKFRIDKNNKETFNKVINNIDLLNKEKLDHNILIVVTKQNVKHIKEIFEFFKKRNEKFLQFIPVIADKKNDFSLSENDYKNYLLDLFSCYYETIKNGDYISIRNMDNFVRLVGHQDAEQCGMNGRCSLQFVFESNGDIYPCDFYCEDKYLLGNIKRTDFDSLIKNNKVSDFINEKQIEEKCKICTFYSLCKGGCKKENESFDRCLGTKNLFEKNIDKFKWIYNKFLSEK